MSKLNATQIVSILQENPEQAIQSQKRIYKEGHIKDIILALQESNIPIIRQMLCDILGRRHSKMAVPALIRFLDDPSPNVQSAAADALANIGDPRAGSALMAHFIKEETALSVRRMVAVALGAVGYQPAVPHLIQQLSDPDPSLRGSVAWSLGVLRAYEATGALQQALAREQKTYPLARMQAALQQITEQSP